MVSLPNLIRVVLLICCYVFTEHRAWPSEFVWWVWAIVAAHTVVVSYVWSLQYAARNVARVYAFREKQSPLFVTEYTLFLLPDSRLYALNWFSSLASFSCLLFYQGWATLFVCFCLQILLMVTICWPLLRRHSFRRIQTDLRGDAVFTRGQLLSADDKCNLSMLVDAVLDGTLPDLNEAKDVMTSDDEVYEAQLAS